MSRSRWGAGAGLALSLALTAIVYRDLLHVYFWADDFMCLLKMADWSVPRFVLEPFAGHVPVLRNAVFEVTYRLFGLDSTAFFASVLLTHLVNTWLVFRLVRTLTDSVLLAAFGATLWGTSPLDAGALGWYSVYGQVLLTAFVLAVLDQAVRHPAPTRPRVAGWCALMLLGVTCFGVGLALAAVFPAVLFLLAPATFRDRALRHVLLALPFLVAALYVGLQRFYAVAFAPPNVHELFTRQSVFAGQPWTIPAMFWHLLLYGTSATVVGFLRPFVYPSALTSAVGAGCLVVVAAGLASADAAERRRLLGLLLLALAAYAAIAVGRAQLASLFGIPPVRSAQQGRYHYLAPALVCCALCAALASVGRRGAGRALGAAGLAVWAAGGSYGYARTTWRIDEHPVARSYVHSTLALIDLLVDQRPAGGAVDIRNVLVTSPAVLGPRLMLNTFPGSAGVFAIAYPENALRGRRVRFVERDRSLVAAFRTGGSRRMADLLVTPDEVGDPTGAPGPRP